MAGELRERDRNKLSAERFAFPAERKEPLTDASHVRNAIAQVRPGRGRHRRRA